MSMSKVVRTLLASAVLLALGALSSCSQTATAGPNGGDVVPIENGTAKAEVVANAETGEVMVHTWDNDLKDHRPVEAAPLRIGSADGSVQLMPHPLPSDPPGQCSRFYGHAEWLHGGSIERGWLECCGSRATRHQFAWNNCWRAGGRHGAMWSEMGEHRPGGAGGRGGMGHGHGGG